MGETIKKLENFFERIYAAELTRWRKQLENDKANLVYEIQTRDTNIKHYEASIVANEARVKKELEKYDPTKTLEIMNEFTRLIEKHKVVESVTVDGDNLHVTTKPLFAKVREKEGSRVLKRTCLGSFKIIMPIGGFPYIQNMSFFKTGHNRTHWGTQTGSGAASPCLGEYEDEVRRFVRKNNFYSLFDVMHHYLLSASDDGSAYSRSHIWKSERFRVMQNQIITRHAKSLPVAKSGALLKKNDKVMIVKGIATNGGSIPTGSIGRVLHVDSSSDEKGSALLQSCHIEFKNFIGGHDAAGMGKRGHCWTIPASNLAKIPPTLYSKSGIFDFHLTELFEKIDALPAGTTSAELDAVIASIEPEFIRINKLKEPTAK